MPNHPKRVLTTSERRDFTLPADKDQFPLAVTSFTPTEPASTLAVVVLVNATGVQARFYHAYSQFLSTRGVAAFTFDYRYCGFSFPPGWDRERLVKDEEYYEKALLSALEEEEGGKVFDLTNTWSRVDLATVVRLAHQSYPTLPLTLIGHSLGGHFLPLLPRSHIYGPVAKVSRIMNVCGGNAHWRNHEDPETSRFGFEELVFKTLHEEKIFRASTLGLGYDLPFGPGKEWIEWYNHPHFSLNRVQDLRLARELLGVEYLYLGFEDDESISKRMMTQYLGMLNHSDGMKRSLWLDPKRRRPVWPSCGHVNAFAKTKSSENRPVPNGEGYEPSMGTEAEGVESEESELTREETIWELMLSYVLGEDLEVGEGDEYKTWTVKDERDVLPPLPSLEWNRGGLAVPYH
ncbi:hypothetical protein IE53DRAFT_389326 [Violaceomyces palustris]|uniref:Uncharacterized protein n=1 Tax=Violaceomyces palustris TaxID=1673888 RepID=A0ACD0NRP5_9BASI|nr:hypothetical protein IE53DRAFT_389326 [Violaceomyces palustris]